MDKYIKDAVSYIIGLKDEYEKIYNELYEELKEKLGEKVALSIMKKLHDEDLSESDALNLVSKVFK